MALGPRHKALFEQYVKDLHLAAENAKAGHGEGRIAGKRLLAAADPKVLGVIVQYYFRCKQLNEDIEAEGGTDEVEPLIFVHEMLTGKHQDLWNFLAELPYLPLGLRRDDTRV